MKRKLQTMFSLLSRVYIKERCLNSPSDALLGRSDITKLYKSASKVTKGASCETQSKIKENSKEKQKIFKVAAKLMLPELESLCISNLSYYDFRALFG